jgi:predicted outer membrane protein
MRLTIASFALLLAVGLVNAEDKKETTKKDVEDPKAFLPLALDEAMAIERFSSLADRRASSDKVKELARKLEADAKDYRKQLEKAAEGLKVGFLTGLREGNQATYVRLATLSGEKFDEEYLKAIDGTLTTFNRHVVDQEKSKVETVSKFYKDRHKGIEVHLKSVRDMRKPSTIDEKPKDK